MTSLRQLAYLHDMAPRTLSDRLSRGMSIVEALSVPIAPTRRKLSPAARAEVRERLRAGIAIKAIAREFGVCRHTVQNLKRRMQGPHIVET